MSVGCSRCQGCIKGGRECRYSGARKVIGGIRTFGGSWGCWEAVKGCHGDIRGSRGYQECIGGLAGSVGTQEPEEV